MALASILCGTAAIQTGIIMVAVIIGERGAKAVSRGRIAVVRTAITAACVRGTGGFAAVMRLALGADAATGAYAPVAFGIIVIYAIAVTERLFGAR